MWGLVRAGALVEAFLLALIVVAPVGGIALSVSPLARAWPVLLVPARALFGATLVRASVAPERGWLALALLGTLLVGAACAAGSATLVARRVAQPDRRVLLLILGVAAVLGLTLLLLPVLPSDDVFSYILYGRIAAVYHANPLVAVPADFPADPFLPLVYWQGVRAVYGPVWLLLSAGVAQVASWLGGSLVAYVTLFKLLGLAADLACSALIWAILGRIAPRRQVWGTVLFAWNPLCLLEFAASAHNDAVMLALLLLGIYLLARGWEAPALVAFGLAIATKYMPLVLLPLYGWWVLRWLRASGASWRAVALALGWRAGVVAATLVVTALPYWSGPRTLGALLYSPPAQSLDNSLIESISWPLRWLAQGMLGLSVAGARAVVELGLKGLALLLFTLLWLWQFRRARSLEGTLLAWGWALVWYCLVASGWFWPWYVTWALAVVALVPWGRLSVVTLLLAGGVLTLYAFLPLQAAPIYGYRAGVAFGPALAYLGWQGAWRWRGGWRPPVGSLAGRAVRGLARAADRCGLAWAGAPRAARRLRGGRAASGGREARAR